jgi:hypothetical protein
MYVHRPIDPSNYDLRLLAPALVLLYTLNNHTRDVDMIIHSFRSNGLKDGRLHPSIEVSCAGNSLSWAAVYPQCLIETL